MHPHHRSVSTVVAVLVGLASLAAAIGIGRFAITSLLPLMQEDQGLTLLQGAWLASANYLGYFVDAASTFLINPQAGIATRWGLPVVPVSMFSQLACLGV